MTKNKDGYVMTVEAQRDQLLAEVLLRITAVENILMKKKIIQDKEIQDEIKILSAKIVSIMGLNTEAPELLGMSGDEGVEIEIDVEDIEINNEQQNLFKDFSLTTNKVSKGN